MELTDGEFKKVEEIFQRCLPVAWNVDIFQFYLDYIRRMNNVLTGGEQARITITQAYEFVLSVVGIDKDSGRIWADYLEFIRSSQVYIQSIDLTLRPMRNGKSNRKWTRHGKFSKEQFVSPSKIWNHYGKPTMHLKTISTKLPLENSSRTNHPSICKRAQLYGR